MKNIIQKFTSTVAAICLVGAFSVVTAQSPVDIGLFETGNDQLEVRVRPQAAFDGILSSLVFTIRWDASTGASLGAPAQAGDVTPYLLANKSGGAHEEGSSNYQIFAGFGMEPMSAHGISWEAGKEYVVMTMPVSGSAEFELINDNWTGELTNNGDFYLALGGKDATGEIYKSLSTMNSLESSVNIQPNPNNGVFNLSFFADEEIDIELTVVNTLGQSVFTEKLQNFSGRYNNEMDISQESKGVYYVKLNDGTSESVHKVVFQ